MFSYKKKVKLMRIEEVPINHPDLLKLVRKLDYFFEEQ